MSTSQRPLRFAACIEYDGSHFYGWQTQGQTRTVQACVEAALAKIANAPIRVVCAGRTDTGVHATGQIVHFESPVSRPPKAWVQGGNTYLPADVNVVWACPVGRDFHARFAARERTYRYVFFNCASPSALLRERVTWIHRPLDLQRMQAAANYLHGEHDFSSLRTVACQAKSPVREIRRLNMTRRGAFIYLDVTANAFLHHMVRNIAGVLLAVGSGEQAPAWVGEVLAARDRTVAGVTAPARGLYLVEVRYDSSWGLPHEPRWPCFG